MLFVYFSRSILYTFPAVPYPKRQLVGIEPMGSIAFFGLDQLWPVIGTDMRQGREENCLEVFIPQTTSLPCHIDQVCPTKDHSLCHVAPSIQPTFPILQQFLVSLVPSVPPVHYQLQDTTLHLVCFFKCSPTFLSNYCIKLFRSPHLRVLSTFC